MTGCLNCGPRPAIASMDQLIAVGFGSASVTRDGEYVYDESSVEDEAFWTFADAEAMAALDPDHHWIASLYGPLSSAEYTRHGANEWHLTKTGEGFA